MNTEKKQDKKNTHYIKVGHYYIHYIEEGIGDPILFLHGNPTSSYIWRNIIPYLSDKGRCLAPDLIGMGKSEKPHIKYDFMTHYQYIREFIEKMGLANITFVLHDWGSAIGFYYALNYPENVKEIAFMESIIKPWKWAGLKWNYRLGFWLLRTPLVGEIMIYGRNAFINDILPSLIHRKLNKDEFNNYKAPFKKISKRKPMLKWPREIPINGNPKYTYQIVKDYSDFLKQSNIPKLLIHAKPGAMIRKNEVMWAQSQIKNLTCKFIGPGKHFLQESQPKQIGLKIREWWLDLK